MILIMFRDRLYRLSVGFCKIVRCFKYTIIPLDERMPTRLQDSMSPKQCLQCDTSAMSFTSVVLLGDEDENLKKNGQVGVTERFFALFGKLFSQNSEAFSVNCMRTTKR